MTPGAPGAPGAHGGGTPGAPGGGPGGSRSSGALIDPNESIVLKSNRSLKDPSPATKDDRIVPNAESSDDATDFTAWLPANSEIVLTINVPAVWEDSLFDGLRDDADVVAAREHIEATLGISISDIESITMGMPMPNDAAAVPEVTVVVRTSEAVDAAAVLDAIAEESGEKAQARVQGDARYHVITSNGVTNALYAPDDYTMVVAPESVMQELIDEEGETAAAARLSLCGMGTDLVLGFAPQDLSAFDAIIPATPGAYRSAAIGADLEDDLQFEIQVECTSVAQAEAEARDFVDQFVIGLGPTANDPIFDPIIDSIETSTDGEVFTANFMFPRDVMQQIVTNAADQMLMNGFNFAAPNGAPGKP
jgi:hypothetical protein